MKINLALQGGGAHGAFTWGVLDRFLKESKLEIVGISGTSAGAMNGAAVKCGMAEGGNEGARAKLAEYWKRVANFTPVADIQDNFFAMSGPFAGIVRENFKDMGLTPNLDQLQSYWSPYTHNPFDINALRDLVIDLFPKDLLCGDLGPKLFVNATNVRTGRIKVFTGDELSREALLASAALPSVFKAVEIDGEAYWDGGFTGNPALFPLIDETDCEDFVIIHVNPLYRDELPKSPTDIENRVNEISFNTPLLRELRQIDFIARWMHKNELHDTRFKNLRIHSIADEKLMNNLTAESKVFSNQRMIDELFDAGHTRAEAFLENHTKDIGHHSSLDIAALVRGDYDPK